LDIAFTTIFFLEMLVKIVVLGFRRYVSNLKNCFDGAVSALSVVTLVLILLPHSELSDPVALRRIMALRTLRLLRICAQIPTLPPIVSTFVRMLPSATELLLTMLLLMYFFSVLGMQLFGGLINKDPARPEYALLKDDDFGESNYWVNNFNDIPSGMVVCFELIMVNNWMVFSDGFSVVTRKWARWFCVACYIFGVLIMLNIVVAFVLDAFMAQYEDAQKEQDDDPHENFTVPNPFREVGDGTRKLADDLGGKVREASEYKIDLDKVPEEQRAAIRQRLARASPTEAASGHSRGHEQASLIAE